ncbi:MULTISPECIES: hypothetical protein [Streptomyces]|uniref:Uncharacterized protein n=1 Tax=Streptomyces siderophoricus TaxID=2802281 RepID=A0ABS1MS82_9ACTN|nr:hypothetical protein [Streptomyces sp. 9-7]MBL1090595.1 hypothetical protein [Streptomyces sp. 9-7]
MATKRWTAAAGAVVVLVLGAVGNVHGVVQRPAAVTPAEEAPADNTPWT